LVAVSTFNLRVSPVPNANYIPKSYASKCLKLSNKYIKKYSYYFFYCYEYFKNEETIWVIIDCLHKISAPCRLNEIRDIAQLTAFLTYNYSSNNKFWSAKYAWFYILLNPWGVDNSSPKNKVAYLLILTILQWQYADAKPTKPKSIILPLL